MPIIIVIGVVVALLVAVGGADLFASTGTRPSSPQEVPDFCCLFCCEGCCLNPLFVQFGNAIGIAEGYPVNGSRPQRNNNPGDLRIKGDLGFDCQGYGKFSTPELGQAALYHQLELIVNGKSRVYNLGMTIAEMAQKWTATTNEQSAWAVNVANSLGGTPNDTLRMWLV